MSDIVPRSNVRITVRERGKLIPGLCRLSHNIWVNRGRQYLAQRIAIQTIGAPNTPQDANEVQYMGVGDGGSALIAADPTTFEIQSPVLITNAPLYLQTLAIPINNPFNTITFVGSFELADITYPSGPTQQDISEIALYLSSADPTLANGSAGATVDAVAYDYFEAIPKAGNFQIRIDWEVSF